MLYLKCSLSLFNIPIKDSCASSCLPFILPLLIFIITFESNYVSGLLKSVALIPLRWYSKLYGLTAV